MRLRGGVDFRRGCEVAGRVVDCGEGCGWRGDSAEGWVAGVGGFGEGEYFDGCVGG